MRNGSTPFSSSASHAARTSPTSRLPQASESAQVGGSCTRHRELLDLPRADLLAARPGRELLDLLLEEARCRRRRSRPGGGQRRPSPARRAARTRSAPRRTGPSAWARRTRAPRRLAGDRLASASSFDGSSATSASTAPPTGSARYASSASASAFFHLSTPWTTTSRPAPKRPSEFSAAAASSPDVVAALSVLDRLVAEPRPQAAERAADLRAIGSGKEVDRAQLVGHRG